MQDLADEYVVSSERLRQIEAQALQSLRSHLASA
ncbi:MAG: sigma factor-like helix-turn-helix DNA-binding protein [Fluviibacter sp.]